MNDLFTRLARRALAEAGCSTWTEVAVDPGWDEIENESSATTTITSPAGPVTLESPAATSLTPHNGGEAGRDDRIGRDGSHELPGALVPVPSVVPAARESALLIPGARDGAPQRVPTASVSSAPDHDVLQADQRDGLVVRGLLVVPPLRNAPSIESDPPVTKERWRDPSPAPAVEVSVGRIEIRVRPPAAGRGVASDRTVNGPAPAMPLDEYLSRRGESA